MRLTTTVAQKRIRGIAKDSENVILGKHARKRMIERSILDADLFRVLREGYVDDEPRKTKNGEWQCKVTLKLKGERIAGAITIILHNGKLFVKTVEWEDVS